MKKINFLLLNDTNIFLYLEKNMKSILNKTLINKLICLEFKILKNCHNKNYNVKQCDIKYSSIKIY